MRNYLVSVVFFYSQAKLTNMPCFFFKVCFDGFRSDERFRSLRRLRALLQLFLGFGAQPYGKNFAHTTKYTSHYNASKANTGK